MVRDILPGLILAVALGMFFCLDGQRGSTAQKRPRPVRVDREIVAGNNAADSIFHLRATSSASIQTDDALPHFSDHDLLAMAPGATIHRSEVLFPVSTGPALADRADVGDPLFRYGLASESALASTNVCAPETGPFIPTSAYPELPAKGIYLWSDFKKTDAKQKPRKSYNSMYTQSEKIYSFGIKQDWSVDSVIGVSLDLVKSRIATRHAYDSRRNEVTGQVVNAHFGGTFMGKFPVEAKALYGWFEHEGSGLFAKPGTALISPWREEKHRSTLMGLSVKAGLPLVYGNDLKVLPELGVDYRRLKTKAHDIVIHENRATPLIMDAVTSKSLAVPLSVTVKRDLPQAWGLVTPRVKLGVTYEFEKSADGVRTYNSHAAGYADYDPTNDELFPTAVDPVQKRMMHVGVGVDVKTVGGWEMSADFTREMAEKYYRNSFRLELGRCF